MVVPWTCSSVSRTSESESLCHSICPLGGCFHSRANTNTTRRKCFACLPSWRGLSSVATSIVWVPHCPSTHTPPLQVLTLYLFLHVCRRVQHLYFSTGTLVNSDSGYPNFNEFGHYKANIVFTRSLIASITVLVDSVSCIN